ncbi:TRAP transporter small permease [Palleronia aestuarii]|nr:TRAP transporter small permease subunit [Palleronia aestuarii]
MRILKAVLIPLQGLNTFLLMVGLWLALLALAAMVAVVILQVWYRYVLGNALPWPDEAARFLMLWMTGLAAPWGLRHHGFVAIEMLSAALPSAGARALNLVFLALGLTVVSMSLSLGWAHVNSGWLFASSSLRLPLDLVGGSAVKVKLAWMYMSIWIGMVLMTLVLVELILREIVKLAGGEQSLTPLDASDLPEAE